MASAGLAAVGRHRLPGGVRVGAVFNASLAVGRQVRALRETLSSSAGPPAAETPTA
jgi:hypothetical protein